MTARQLFPGRPGRASLLCVVFTVPCCLTGWLRWTPTIDRDVPPSAFTVRTSVTLDRFKRYEQLHVSIDGPSEFNGFDFDGPGSSSVRDDCDVFDRYDTPEAPATCVVQLGDHMGSVADPSPVYSITAFGHDTEQVVIELGERQVHRPLKPQWIDAGADARLRIRGTTGSLRVTSEGRLEMFGVAPGISLAAGDARCVAEEGSCSVPLDVVALIGERPLRSTMLEPEGEVAINVTIASPGRAQAPPESVLRLPVSWLVGPALRQLATTPAPSANTSAGVWADAGRDPEGNFRIRLVQGDDSVTIADVGRVALLTYVGHEAGRCGPYVGGSSSYITSTRLDAHVELVNRVTGTNRERVFRGRAPRCPRQTFAGFSAVGGPNEDAVEAFVRRHLGEGGSR